MSGPSRIHFAAGLVLAGLSISPASSNPLTALFNSAPEQAPAPAPAKEECLQHPGKPADGQHWVYRLDSHRKCWFSVPAETFAATKPVRRYAAKRRLDADEDKAALPEAEAVENARAELLRPTPAEAPQPAPPPSAVQAVDVADAAPVPTGAAALVPPPPVLSKSDPFKPDDSNPAPNNPEALLAATPADSDATAVAVPAATLAAAAVVETGDERQWWTAPWLGPLLMAVGALVLLSSPIWPRPRAALVAERPWCPDVDDREDLPGPDFSPRTRPRDRRHAEATPRPLRPRQGIEGQRTSRPPGQRRQDVTFQEAIKALTDVSNS